MPVTGIDRKVIVQVCLIVSDVETIARRWSEIMGWTLPNFMTTLRHDVTKATHFGKPTNARIKMLLFNVGQIQFEVMQPLDEDSTWHDFHSKHGDGIHHVAFFVPQTAPAAESFAQHGYVITQQGLFDNQGGMYTYLDTEKDLGVVIELLEVYGGTPAFQAPPFDPQKGIGTDVVVQVGMIVHDIEKTAQRYAEVLGLPATGIMVTPGYEQVKTTFRGQPSEATAKLAFFDAGQVQLELIQPDEKPSVWREFLESHGEGAHHVAFRVANTQRAVDHLAQYGITVSQQGLYTDHSGIYTYMDSQEMLGTTLELLENFAR